MAICAVLWAGVTTRAAALTLDPGGFSVDLSGIGATEVTGEDLLRNGGMEETDAAGRPAQWTVDSYVWLPVADPSAQARMHERLLPLMRWESAADRPHGGVRALHLAMPPSAYLASDPAGHEFCAYVHQTHVLPADQGAMSYVLSWWHRGWSAPDVPNSRPYARVTFYDAEDPAQAQQTRVYAQTIFASSEQWQRSELSFSAPAGTRVLDVRLALTGVGEVWFDDVALHRAAISDRGPTVRLMPGSFVDNRYCLSSADAGVMNFGFRNETAAAIDRLHLLLQLPRGIEILDLPPSVPIVEQRPLQVEGADAVEYRLDITAMKGRIRDGSFAYPYNMWDGLELLLRTSLPPSAERLGAWYWLEDGEYRTDPLRFEIQIVPPIPQVTGPTTFRSGAHLFLVHSLVKPEGVEALADLYRKVGLNAVHVPPSPLSDALGRRGIERYVQPFANGYTMGDREPGAKPESAVFRLANGEPVWEAICPTEVYRRGPYFRERIENEMLRGLLVTDRQAEQIMANWEPFMYVGRGCFCERCREEFAAWSRLPAEELARVWPERVVAEHGELWARFRAWQHGRMMVTLEETVHALGREIGLDSHFIPEITYVLVTSSWAKHTAHREYAAVEYLRELPVLEPWGPYNWYVFGSGPYDYVRGLHLSSHVSAREVQGFVTDFVAPAEPPRLIAFPYGTYEGITEPEALAFEFLTYFVNGYHGAFAYLFPGGYDARYWSALAEANRQMALVETLVMAGERVERHRLEAVTPLPAPDPRFLKKCAGLASTERWRDLPLLLSWEFEVGDRRLIAVADFWERGECFFRLAPEDLRPGRQYALHEPCAGRAYAGPDGRVALSARAFSDGILLHAGAMRYSFFVLEPYAEGTDYGAVVRPEEMEAAMRERLPAIEAAFAAAGEG